MAKKLWSEIQIDKGIKLELTWFKPKKCWKKFKGKVFYMSHPNSKSGYEAALLEWAQKKAELDHERPNAAIFQHHKALFQIVKTYWEQFGLPRSEVTLAKQVDQMIDWLDECLVQPTLPDPMAIAVYCANLKALSAELQTVWYWFATRDFVLPEKWQDRIDRLNNKEHKKHPQTIEYWREQYIKRQNERAGKQITKDTGRNKRLKLSYFRKNRDQQAHITTIDGRYIKDFHVEVDGLNLAKRTREDYFDNFKSFLTWCHEDEDCEFVKPANFNSSEFTFREPEGTGRKRLQKKLLLWTPDEVKKAISDLPAPYNCYVILMLNCGFRHQDISSLQHFDLHIDQKRIVIQREKLNQQDTAPVISYPLWSKTLELIQDNISEHEKYVFLNEKGGQVRGSIKTWWFRHKKEYGFDHKRLDYLRKTGSTIIARKDKNLDEFYLGESLKTTSRIHYSFTDGESLKELDDAIAFLGAEYGFCEAPSKTITLTPELMAKMEAAGIEV